MNYLSKVVIVLAAILVAMAGAAGADAQTKKRKRTVAQRPVIAIPQGEAEIISQAGNTIVQPVYATQPSAQPTPTPADVYEQRIRDLNARIKKLESAKPNEYDEKQKRLLLNLDILTRAEQRSESLRKQVFELTEKESTVRTRLDQIDMDSRPEMIARSSTTFTGSMKPEEIREMRTKALESEKRNLQALLVEIVAAKQSVQLGLTRSDELVDRLRTKLEKEIDDALKDEE